MSQDQVVNVDSCDRCGNPVDWCSLLPALTVHLGPKGPKLSACGACAGDLALVIGIEQWPPR